jgi:hypothetical protein
VWTFGERHWSWKCTRRSVAASLVFICAVALEQLSRGHTLGLAHNPIKLPPVQLAAAIAAVLGAVVATDYIALFKTRIILGTLTSPRGLASPLFLIYDMVLSLMISYLGLMATYFLMKTLDVIEGYDTASSSLLNLVAHIFSMPKAMYGWVAALLGYRQSYEFPINGILILSTLFTSVWSAIVLVGTGATKLIAPLHRFTAWCFDVDKHPVQAIGFMSGALVMVGSLIWSAVRALL